MTKKSWILTFIAFIIIILPVSLNYINLKLLCDYTIAYDVGRKFAYSLMTRDIDHMKAWSSPTIHKKIDELSLNTSLAHNLPDFYNFFDLVACRRVGITLVCSYALMLEDAKPFPVYSVLLKPYGPLTVLEKIKRYLYFEFEFASKFTDWPKSPDRWLVYDFLLPENGFDFQKYIHEDINVDIDVDTFEQKMETMGKFEEVWGVREIEQQNREVREIYHSYYEQVFATP